MSAGSKLLTSPGNFPALRIELTPVSGALQCPFCRDHLSHRSWSCPDCQVSLHEACHAELGSCPTVGCLPSPLPRPRARAGAPALEIVRPATLPRVGFLERVSQGLSGRAEPTPGVLALTALACLIPSLYLGWLAGQAAGQNSFFPLPFDWWSAIKSGLLVSLLSFAFSFTLSFGFFARGAYFWRALRQSS